MRIFASGVLNVAAAGFVIIAIGCLWLASRIHNDPSSETVASWNGRDIIKPRRSPAGATIH